MAPKKKDPQRHDQTIATVLRLPISAQRGNLQALLSRPTPLSEGELNQVPQQLSLLLLRANDTITEGEVETFGLMIELLQRSLASSSDAQELAAKSIDKSCDVPARLGEITTALSNLLGRSEWRAQVPGFLLSLEPLCTSASTKELVASFMMEPLLTLLWKNAEVDPDGVDYKVPREATARLIDLVRSSSKNKTLPRSWRVVVTQLLHSNDFFHQLQCIELVFRITRQPRGVPPSDHPLLRSKDFAGPGGLPRNIAERIRDMPADSRMLCAAREVCADVCTEQSQRRAPNRVQQLFSVKGVTFASQHLSDNAVISFGPHYLVLMVCPDAADNVTIPYADVASVRTGRDGAITIRLLRTAEDLRVLLPDIPADDHGGQFILSLDAADALRFKEGPIVSWFKLAREQLSEKDRSAQKREREEQPSSSGAGQLLEPVVLFPKDHRPPAGSAIRSVVEQHLRRFLDQQKEDRLLHVSAVIQEDLDNIQERLASVRSRLQEKISEASTNICDRIRVVSQQVESALPELSNRVESDSHALDPFKCSLTESNNVITQANSQLCDFVEQSRFSDVDFLKEVDRDFLRRVAVLHEHHMLVSLGEL